MGPFQAILSLEQVSPGTLSAKILQHTTVGRQEKSLPHENQEI